MVVILDTSPSNVFYQLWKIESSLRERMKDKIKAEELLLIRVEGLWIECCGFAGLHEREDPGL